MEEIKMGKMNDNNVRDMRLLFRNLLSRADKTKGRVTLTDMELGYIQAIATTAKVEFPLLMEQDKAKEEKELECHTQPA